MPSFDIIKRFTDARSFRIDTVASMFTISLENRNQRFTGNIDIEDKEWNVGLIYGASGSGKTTIARELWSTNYIRGFSYQSASILDDMPKDIELKHITQTMNSVGFSTPPSWLKSYDVLSTGEKMRVDLARAILEMRDLIVFDEFTSVVDRTVAKIGSAAVSKAIKRLGKKFIAVSCHNDIANWLEPDWTFCTDDMKFSWTRGLLRRPKIELRIEKCNRDMWQLFGKHHYLDTSIHKASQCYLGRVDSIPVAFTAVLHFPHAILKNCKREHRTVVLPDFQGVGIGHGISTFVANIYVKRGFKYRSRTSNPAFINSRSKDNGWKLIDGGSIAARGGRGAGMGMTGMGMTSAVNRITTGWEYVGE